MQAVSPEKVQVRAYELWEQDGRPDGKAEEYWYRATTELSNGNGNGASVNGTAKKPRKKVAAAAAVVSEPAVKPKKKAVKKAN